MFIFFLIINLYYILMLNKVTNPLFSFLETNMLKESKLVIFSNFSLSGTAKGNRDRRGKSLRKDWNEDMELNPLESWGNMNILVDS